MPGDPASEDGQLAVAMNVAKDNEIDCSIIEKPATLFILGTKDAIFIHQNNGYKHYILLDGETLYYRNDTTTTEMFNIDGSVYAIEAMGNTIILNDNNGLHYIKWDAIEMKYVDLGQKPPMVNIRFGLDSQMKCYPQAASDVAVIKTKFYTDEVPLPFISDSESTSFLPPENSTAGQTIKSRTEDPFTDFSFDLSGKVGTSTDGKDNVDTAVGRWTAAIMSYVNKFIADIAEDNKFCMPFFVRYAYEMYDGSMVMHSYPVYMIPSGRGVFFGLDGMEGISLKRIHKDQTYEKVAANFKGRVYGTASKLVMKLAHTNLNELKKWKDLIKGVGIYVTPPIYTHRQGGKVTGWLSMDGASNNTDILFADFFSEGNFTSITGSGYVRNAFNTMWSNEKSAEHIAFNNYVSASESNYTRPNYIMRLEYLNKTEYEKEIANASQFFRVGGIDFDDLIKGNKDTLVDVVDKNDKTAVSALTSAQQMKDDYHTHDVIDAATMNVYNHRLNIGNVCRTLHSPISPSVQMPYLFNNENVSWKIAVYTKSGDKQNVVVSELGACDCGYPGWLFYPDSKAYKAVLERTEGTTVRHFVFELKEHKLLEGAYCYLNSTSYDSVTVTMPTVTDGTVCDIGYIYTSDVENPFVFPASGVNQVGDGEVLAMAQAVQALSEGQFGAHPMYCFTSQGVWALAPNADGSWKSVQPVTRDVLASGTTPLSIDTSVIFISGRGVMLLSGSTSKVIDTAIQGEWKDSFNKLSNVIGAWDTTGISSLVTGSQLFTRIGANTRMVYDYKHQRVYFCCGEFSWVLNLKTWTWTQSQTKVSRELNSYPECEFVSGTNVCSLDGDSRYAMAVMLTRPIKTAGEMLAKVRALVVRGNVPCEKENVVATALFGCRDWHSNVLVKTSTKPRISAIGGTGFRTHSLLVMMKDQTSYKTVVERAVVDIQEVQYDKCR